MLVKQEEDLLGNANSFSEKAKVIFNNKIAF